MPSSTIAMVHYIHPHVRMGKCAASVGEGESTAVRDAGCTYFGMTRGDDDRGGRKMARKMPEHRR